MQARRQTHDPNGNRNSCKQLQFGAYREIHPAATSPHREALDQTRASLFLNRIWCPMQTAALRMRRS